MHTKKIFCALALFSCLLGSSLWSYNTEVSINGSRWYINGEVTNPSSEAEGLLMNTRMVNSVFEDRNRSDFDPVANTDQFIAALPSYYDHGVNAVTLNLQGGMPGYEGAKNSAFKSDGTLRASYLNRVERVIEAADKQGMVVILGFWYQRQAKSMDGDSAIRNGTINAMRWLKQKGYSNVVIEIANEYSHHGYKQSYFRDSKKQAELIRLAKKEAPKFLVSTSSTNGSINSAVAEAGDFLMPHWNTHSTSEIAGFVKKLKKYGKPITCNEDARTGSKAVKAMKESVRNGCGYGLMHKSQNQVYPFRFEGAKDDTTYYNALRDITSKR